MTAPAEATLLLTHPACLGHDPGPGHPECVARLASILAALDAAADLPGLRRVEAPRATREQLLRVHDASMVDGVFAAAPEAGHVRIDADTVMSAGSLEAALHAAGAAVAAVDAVLGGDARRAFCAVRPPGHHATRDTPMGFCLWNNIAVAAAHALAAHGLERVAIIDFDVHHGNGTQDIFFRDPRVLYASTHQSPLYPGTGARNERGVGQIVNAPLPPGSGSAAFRAAITGIVQPALAAFAPQLVLVSAGFDAHRRDPLANLELGADDFGWVTAQLVATAERHAQGRIVSSLEGGYDLGALADSSVAHVRELAR